MPPRSATEEELMLMVDEVETGGFIKKADSLRIKSAIEFSDIRVREIMTPRVDIEAIDISEGNKAALAIFQQKDSPVFPFLRTTTVKSSGPSMPVILCVLSQRS